MGTGCSKWRLGYVRVAVVLDEVVAANGIGLGNLNVGTDFNYPYRENRTVKGRVQDRRARQAANDLAAVAAQNLFAGAHAPGKSIIPGPTGCLPVCSALLFGVLCVANRLLHFVSLRALLS